MRCEYARLPEQSECPARQWREIRHDRRKWRPGVFMPTSFALAAAAIALMLMMLIWWRRERRRSRTKPQRALSPEEAERREKAITDINKRLERLRAQQQRIAQEAQLDSRRAADAVRKIMQQDNRRRA